MPMRPTSTDGFEFAMTGYAGHADQILRLRNANRPIAQSATYLDWRYGGSLGTREPKVFWIRDQAGRALGMASLIFRRFWVNNELQQIAVLGDISLDSELRGRGLGRSLLKFMSGELERNDPACLAFVIPNPAAQAALASIGWSTGGRFIPYVFMLNPEQKLRQVVRSSWLARGLGSSAGKLITRLVRMHRRHGYFLGIVGALDNSFETLWQSYDKANVALSDRGIAALTWRYVDHPHCSFKFAKLVNHGRLVGYLVYELSQANRECTVYDLLLLERGDLGCMLALLVGHIAGQDGIDAIRLLLNEQHPYGKLLWKLGFIARDDAGVFQLHGPKAQVQSREATWFLTYGDKDI